MTRKLNIVLFTLLVFVGGPFYWLLLNASTAEPKVQPLTIGQLRRLAAALPEEAPREVRYEEIGQRWVMRNLLAAGSGLRMSELPVRAYEVVMPDKAIITIDRGLPRGLAQEDRLENFDPAAQARVEAAVHRAKIALVLAPRLQHTGRHDAPPGFGSGISHPSGESPYRVAPGVVVIPASDVTREERMVYVRTVDGSEFLFAGDIAPIEAAWMEVRPPARLVTTYLSHHNREALAAWLRTVRRFKAEAPALQIVAGHDIGMPGSVKRGFIAPSDYSMQLRDNRLALQASMR